MKTYFVIDVESLGLHGKPFAVAGLLIRENGEVLDSFCWCTDRSERHEWVDQNIPIMIVTHNSLEALLLDFWSTWLLWRQSGAMMVCDCPWPVEAGFLKLAMETYNTKYPYKASEWSGPYPLIDVSSILLAKGVNPITEFERLSDELPKHHPLADVRQSARIFLTYISPSYHKESPILNSIKASK